MKKIITLAAVAAISVSVSVFAQTDQIHVFRSDDTKLSTFKGADILSITHENGSAALGFNDLVIKTTDGTSTTISIGLIDSVQVRSTGLPEFHVNLIDYPSWTELQGAKDDVHPAILYMKGNGMYSDIEADTVEFRGRGNSTWGMKKKPYRFKMKKKAAVCGLPKAKTFALIANYIDCSLMRNAVSLWVANYLQMPFANHCIPVRVYFNDILKGEYMLTEKIGTGSGSVNIDEYKGVLFELDSNYDEAFEFYFRWDGGKSLPVMVKDPDFTEICDSLGVTTAQYLQTWQSDFTQMAQAVTSGDTSADLSQYIDLESAVNFFIVNNLAANHEMKHPKSFYIYKDSIADGETYHFGPVWDFDWAYTFDGYEGVSASIPMVASDGDCGGYSFLKALFSNTGFRALYKQKWDEFISVGYPQLLKYMEEYANLIEPAAIENGQLWPADYSVSWRRSESSLEFRKNFKALKTWIGQRIDYCNLHANFGLYE